MTMTQGPKHPCLWLLSVFLSLLHLTLPPSGPGFQNQRQDIGAWSTDSWTLLSKVHEFPKWKVVPASFSWQIPIQPGFWPQVKHLDLLSDGHGSFWKTKYDRDCLQATEDFISFSMWCYYSSWSPPERSRTRYPRLIRLCSAHTQSTMQGIFHEGYATKWEERGIWSQSP